jgi:hypothetical protein
VSLVVTSYWLSPPRFLPSSADLHGDLGRTSPVTPLRASTFSKLRSRMYCARMRWRHLGRRWRRRGRGARSGRRACRSWGPPGSVGGSPYHAPGPGPQCRRTRQPRAGAGVPVAPAGPVSGGSSRRGNGSGLGRGGPPPTRLHAPVAARARAGPGLSEDCALRLDDPHARVPRALRARPALDGGQEQGRAAAMSPRNREDQESAAPGRKPPPQERGRGSRPRRERPASARRASLPPAGSRAQDAASTTREELGSTPAAAHDRIRLAISARTGPGTSSGPSEVLRAVRVARGAMDLIPPGIHR